MEFHMGLFCSFILSFVLSHLVAHPLARNDTSFVRPDCPPFDCGNFGFLGFPFNNETLTDCGLYTVRNCSGEPKIQLKRERDVWFDVVSISQANVIHINDTELQKQINSRNCSILDDLSLPTSPSFSLSTNNNITLSNCTDNPGGDFPLFISKFSCPGIYSILNSDTPPNCSTSNSRFLVPVLPVGPNNSVLEFTADFQLRVTVSSICYDCFREGGQCSITNEKFVCKDGKREASKDKSRMSLWIGLGVGVLGVNLLMLLFALWYCKKRRAAPTMLTRNISCEPYSKFDLEDGGVCFEVPVFSYGELEMATNKFDRDKELGDGGFGTVYHGKLLDGREVAVKRLYQHNYRRVEQFMNEVKILTRLRHKNLVSLYGCTSKRSRELLLVYEFVANGTVADHLHGEQASFSLLTWPIRMTIAIETASALVYLHASDIIHRDVKTTNILLDSNFSVKVADFGLSRLFPNDVSHVSTAPQGTPGYVDPEYYQCYQLTTKSDVYSFGVVLIELISSMPAVDITRHRHEINLSNLAVDKILRQEIDELIDPCLGYQSDEKVRRMILAVAWLAFLCLQQDKERRPTMEEALETLKRIESGEENENLQDNSALSKSYDPAPSPEYDEVELLKNKRQQLLSPTSVADKWISSTSFVSASTSLSSIS
ncbi:LEAF RUST 10 DISEASE-RESISTANCE LOCUS RECEPTOR-LIKE PROTEIN KINASE-like 1.1 isoform X1 [Cucurbita pepo subsp. pepo]|uniref:LEAF RUST 10 DISEASE-RESISTANCE LOCUS RECEPTOR-LIKE PROTEIN KINASE-like 1.1 isoform X1 n=1 Tax=Cucurbita pepo subsp. pepo TaxID=3664 RepID=UPI000C9D968A|nr:LEAF RUST 10 DISEASE-RESISTANCE LOCUS RECEPTOR-LIKE PROTEIN KINASE-like 1.1 isoform X1 [Cucurbita pepo subsp. pepo]